MSSSENKDFIIILVLLLLLLLWALRHGCSDKTYLIIIKYQASEIKKTKKNKNNNNNNKFFDCFKHVLDQTVGIVGLIVKFYKPLSQ